MAETGGSPAARREWAVALDAALRARGIELAEAVAVAQGDPVEEALASALAAAAAAGQWASVEVLARELEARRRARAGVASLNDARARKSQPR